jgi:N-formylglutamate deformylase
MPIPMRVVFHVPHSSTEIPAKYRDQFLLTDAELQEELEQMTDHNTDQMVAEIGEVVRFPYSRLLIDVERFWDGAQESMSQIGMGAIYRVGHMLQPLRRELTELETSELKQIYEEHHFKLEQAVEQALEECGRCLLIDLHSYPQHRLPYEMNSGPRPQLCLGTDDFHTPEWLVNAAEKLASKLGYNYLRNTPFTGTLVPMKHYQQDPRVMSLMLEWRRDIYHHQPDQTEQIHRIREFQGELIGQFLESILFSNNTG